ncbi:ABC transporter permease [Tistrella bauzanensis]|uniref:ABC transporter permease n=1 Tax=Tistrella bauzanensis TaxID=657419 RepID=A0ABQ1IDQ4_9PROT|nr:ABC transporter permease [Tistrella bauzanensis]GGB36510.1 ABC transporter permease [Tistrella bauzanensis]
MLNSLRGIAARMIKIAVMILIIATFNFMLVHAAPGDPAAVIAGQSGASDEKLLAQVRAEYGLDQPLHVQLTDYLAKVASFDLGYSYRQRQPVSVLIGERLPATLLLTVTAFLLALGIGSLLGTLAGVRAGKWTDTVISIAALLFYAMPVFWLGLMLVLIFSVRLDWLPAFGFSTIGPTITGIDLVLDVATHMVLPVATLAAIYLAIYARLMRASIIEVEHQDYVKTARAKGLARGQVIRRHMLRNALLPVVTFAGVQAGALIGGSVVVETVFAWPGLGRLTFEAVMQRDYPVLLGVFLVMSVLVIAINLLTDLITRIIDPRLARAG